MRAILIAVLPKSVLKKVVDLKTLVLKSKSGTDVDFPMSVHFISPSRITSTPSGRIDIWNTFGAPERLFAIDNAPRSSSGNGLNISSLKSVMGCAESELLNKTAKRTNKKVLQIFILSLL